MNHLAVPMAIFQLDSYMQWPGVPFSSEVPFLFVFQNVPGAQVKGLKEWILTSCSSEVSMVMEGFQRLV